LLSRFGDRSEEEKMFVHPETGNGAPFPIPPLAPPLEKWNPQRSMGNQSSKPGGNRLSKRGKSGPHVQVGHSPKCTVNPE
jgi:hypothetical protein